MKVKLIRVTENPEELIVQCAGICYDKSPDVFDKTKFIPRLMSMGHLSVFEHASATFLIEGISRACSHQLVRHRMASYTMESQRYVNQQDAESYLPDSIKNKEEAMDIYNKEIERLSELYAQLINLGVPKEDARYILPNAITTKIYVTMNFRELLHFFDLRIDKHAQLEIRNMAKEMFHIIEKIAPNTFKWRDEWK